MTDFEQLTDTNAQREYYITDCPGILLKAGKTVIALKALQPCEALSINTVDDLKLVEVAMEQLEDV